MNDVETRDELPKEAVLWRKRHKGRRVMRRLAWAALVGVVASLCPRHLSANANNYDIGDLTFAYKLFAPFALAIWAFACAIAGRQIYIRTESRLFSAVAVLVGLSGPLGAFCGFWLWALY